MTTHTARPAGLKRPLAGRSAWRRLDGLQNRVVNPVVRWLLRSTLHDLLSGSVLLLTVRGRRSGRQITVPAGYVERDGELLLISHRTRRWWRNLHDGAPVRVLLRGREWNGTARASLESGRILDTLMAMAADRPAGAARSAWARDGVAIRISLRAPLPRARATGLWRRWFCAAAIGGTAGFAVPAVVAALVADSSRLGPPPRAALIVLAGLGGGAALGLAQAWALRAALPAVPTRAWVRATAAGAGIAWSAGAVPVLLGDTAAAVAWPVPAVMGVTALASMSLLQVAVLRGRHRGHRHRAGPDPAGRPRSPLP
ncbi:nitroreductase/quinone reductase family protein [Planomonospora venezuelensis]|uniref:Deazaflavin-dependent oxidoreductase, nitroreductase family n=1 Tax=Planomonospora venezuelensis TaxID=1999 RepID=A0A841DCA6_PLAVE|nr:hypothetical protein [Planomonospora venezuelensis]GIN01069.1 hypothetical protein Pve01_27270 [Planomonospora venezuelensis]